MDYVTFNGWRPGLNKVALTQLLQSDAGLSLGEAKARTDELLAGRTVRIATSDSQSAQRLREAAQSLGVAVAPAGMPTVRNAG
jgi:hypothetical protein